MCTCMYFYYLFTVRRHHSRISRLSLSGRTSEKYGTSLVTVVQSPFSPGSRVSTFVLDPKLRSRKTGGFRHEGRGGVGKTFRKETGSFRLGSVKTKLTPYTVPGDHKNHTELCFFPVWVG